MQNNSLNRFFATLRYLRPYSFYACMNAICNIFAVVFSLFSITMVIPFLQLLFDKQALQLEAPTESAFTIAGATSRFNHFLSQLIVEEGKRSALIFICVLVMVMFLLRNFFRYAAMWFMAPIRNGVVRDVRQEVFDKMLQLPLSYYSEQKKGDLMARSSSDVQEIEYSIMHTLEASIREPLTIIAYLGAMLYISPKLTAIVFVVLPIAGVIIGTIGKTLKQASRKAQNKLGEIISMIEETIGGLRILQAFNAEPYQKARFRENNNEHFRLMNNMLRRRDLSSPLSEFLSISALVVVLYVGCQMVLNEKGIHPEIFIYFMVIFSQVIPPAKALTSAWYSIQKGMASVDRIQDVLKVPLKIDEQTDAKEISDFQHEIEFRNVSFSYEETPVLKNINLRIPKGKMVALVGPSGAGKSTLADLLIRFHDVTEGQILIDGLDIREIKLSALRSLLGVVTQEALLFNDSVHNNISLGRSNNEQEVFAAGKQANADTFVRKLDQAYQQHIGDRGTKLSGGERQRLTIARALLGKPSILILDEATSNLDAKSEQLVQAALKELMEERTSIVIAHRLSTIQKADLIIVMKDGEIVESGQHQGLLANSALYSHLVQLQEMSEKRS